MFIMETDNEKIGQYLKKCIENRFKSHRSFCKKYLEAAGKPVDSDQIQNMSNRLSQILKGKKEIQLYDLPLFCQLLEVSCEDILSTGKSHAPTTAHLTNYGIAFSTDEREWEAYVNRKDSPILNADEYGKTVIDYALEAENYAFLKYLMNKHYIWFVGKDSRNYITSFGAGTSIEKATFPYPQNWNVLDVQLKMRDELRAHMIALAIQNEDLEMLEQLHAREVPSLYQLSFYSLNPTVCAQYYNKNLMDALTCANSEILEYFSEEFEITDRVGFSNKFLFPFMGELIERLLQSKNPFAVRILERAVQHNQYAYDQLTLLMANATQYFRGLGYDLQNKSRQDDLTNQILSDLNFYDDGSLVSYFALLPETKKGLRTNIIQVHADPVDDEISNLILKLNHLYDEIHNITPHF